MFFVAGKPVVRLPRTITVVEGEKLVLECTVIGKPTPDVTWRYGKLDDTVIIKRNTNLITCKLPAVISNSGHLCSERLK